MTVTLSPFVGRKRELEILELALAGTENGGGRFVAISGEPGMGKTRLVSELASALRDQGRRVLWSQVVEEPGAPPYFPWMQVLRASIQGHADAKLAHDLGAVAPILARIVPELRERLALPDGGPCDDSAAARYQLFDSVSRYLLAGTQNVSLVLLFDNLHLADRSSLNLLDYFCQQLAGQPVMVVGAFRDSELNRRHPLRGVLNRLSRSPAFTRLELDGLSEDESAELLHAHLGEAPPATLVQAVHRQSGGNPLFVNEVGSMLARQLRDRALPTAGFHFQVPESLREVIARRLDTLPSETCELLGIAAVQGHEFDTALLAELSGQPASAVSRRLQAAESAAIIDALGQGRFAFNHVLFREVLYGEHSTLARVLLHRKAGEILEARYAGSPDEHASQLAHHFFESAQAGNTGKAVSYCRRAAQYASAKRAYGEAVALYECALQAAEIDPATDTATRFDLLLAMGQAQYHSGQMNLATQTLMKSAVLAWRERWWARLVDALYAFQLVCQQSGYRHVASVPLHQSALEHLPGNATALRARALASLAKAYRSAAQPDLANTTYLESLALARQSDDPKLLLDCLVKGNWVIGRHPDGAREGLEIAREALQLAEAHGNAEAALNAHTDLVFQLCDLGEIKEAQQHIRTLRQLAERHRHPHFLSVLAGFATALAILQGQWDEALRRASDAVRQVPVLGVLGLEGRFAFQMFAIQRARGELGDLAALARQIIGTRGGAQLWLPGQILLHCELGQKRAACEAFEQLGDPGELPQDDLQGIALYYLAEAAFILRDRARCCRLSELLAPWRGMNATLAGAVMLGAVSGCLANLALVDRHYGEARELYVEALHMNRAMGALPALARTQVDYARLLLRGDCTDDHAQATQLLEEARATANRLQLKPVQNAIEELRTGTGAERLTRRELDVLRLIARGSSNRRIADSLHISHSTVATHVRNIFRKTGVANRTEAADFARSASLLNPE